MEVHQLDVVITNALVTIMCLYFALQLAQMPSTHYDLRRLLVGATLYIGIASAFGGAYHGWLEFSDSEWKSIVWQGAVLFVGLTAFYLWKLSFFFALPQRTRPWTDGLALLSLIAYCYVILYVRRDFVVAVMYYLPALVFLAAILFWKMLVKKDARYANGVIGLLISILAAFVQQAQITIHEEYFTHNALYHLIQAVGLYVFYQFSKRIILWKT